ncbi:MAG: exodeoxyribonuclease VII small subunit [Parvibaculum sp.]|uniref:exodeoxyribonuclease VII small subunit n=1 Tax=Parvibaculum sp. TaxID=2024848 RepID=UPI002ABB8F00|nr:exodeoxyribonuclease VII small subunit [Parvibaculum sp.]MDZ4382137.1 exodeoxyribonuclease VII small subunit [Parvibaculum sp.]
MSAAKADAHKDIEKLSFEEALAQLEKIVSQLESGNAALENSIELYERGTALKAHCEARLKAAEARIEKIALSSSGEPSGTEPLDVG